MIFAAIFNPPKAFLLFFVFAFAFSPAVASDERQWTRGDPCPTKIRVVVPVGSPFGTYEAVHEAMQTCSNITELGLYASSFGCTEFPSRWSLPFALDGSDRYLSSPRVLVFEFYKFDDLEWPQIVPPRPHWSNEDGTWPTTSSSSPVIAWVTNKYYGARWWIDRAQFYLTEGFRTTDTWWWWWRLDRAPRWYKWSSLPVEQRSKDNMELWLEAMDFSQVHTLSIKQDGSFKPKGNGLLHRLPSALTNLRSLTIGGRWVDWKTELDIWEAEPGPLPKNKLKSPRPPRVRDFILDLPSSSLTNLTWTESGTCDASVFDVILQHHGASLRQLEWTSAELETDPRPTLSTDQLRSLGTWAPELTNLTIDLNRENQDWPREKLETLAQSLPKLTDLMINLNLQTAQVQNSIGEGAGQNVVSSSSRFLAQPLLNADSAREMFDLFLKSQTSDKLETMTFREGNWEYPDYGSWLDGEGWVEGVRAWATCSILGPDGLRVEGEPWCRAGYNSEYGYYKDRRY
ncbi:hypothetical protein G7Z17_g2401 [Cylindrodendrum hubeiense]|uniref:Uncharacterized protein n=1 Tax=Cylindrodendrum hubeiense TaxID=595255 RepID=A0A9P5HED1_9HYPO|nr:hypothetical protein G7Z17_g2401 [Cylindrodendrum hubeiense]